MSSEDNVGKRIRDCREALKISQSELAKLVGLSPAAIWHWEAKGRVPRRRTLAKLAGALKVSERYLFEGKYGGDLLSEEKETSVRPRNAVVAQSEPSNGTMTMAAEIEKTRARIAELTGVELTRIKLQLTFVD
jgi:transcriptional regulator with XRE-family HTH domain